MVTMTVTGIITTLFMCFGITTLVYFTKVFWDYILMKFMLMRVKDAKNAEEKTSKQATKQEEVSC